MCEHTPEFEKFAKRVREELLPKITDSSVVVSIVPGSPENLDVKFAVELGVSVMLDKPIIAIVQPGTPIPEKLARVVDKFVELDLDDPGFAGRVGAAISEMIGEKEE